MMTICTQKKQQKQISLDSFHRYWWSKNLAIWLDQRRKLATFNQKRASHMLPSLDDYLHPQKIKENERFFPEILMTKESYNLIGEEPQLTTSNQSRNLRCCLLLMTNSRQRLKLISCKKSKIAWFLAEKLIIQTTVIWLAEHLRP